MNNSNLPQNFDKGNGLPQSPALKVRANCREQYRALIYHHLNLIKTAVAPFFGVIATLFLLTILILPQETLSFLSFKSRTVGMAKPYLIHSLSICGIFLAVLPHMLLKPR